MKFLDDEAIERLAKKITEKYYAFDKGAWRRRGLKAKKRLSTVPKRHCKGSEHASSWMMSRGFAITWSGLQQS